MTRHFTRFARFLWAYKVGKERLGYGPIFVWLEPTNRCNLRCPLCPTGEGLERKRGDMPMELYQQILDKLREAPPLLLTLHLAGEPLLAKNIFQMIRMANEAGIQTTLSTNATLLSEDVSRQLIEAGLGSIRLDFCSDREKFEQVRSGASWDKVYDNIVNLLKLKAELGSEKPIVRIKDVSVSGLPPREREERIRQLKSLFKDYPIKGYSGLSVHNWAGTFASEHEELQKAHHRRSRPHPCTHLWTSIAITCDGLVVPCCRDLEAECVLGDLKEQSLLEVWNGERLRSIRRAMIERKLDGVPLCKDCSRVWEQPRFIFYTFGYFYMRLDRLASSLSRRLGRRLKDDAT